MEEPLRLPTPLRLFITAIKGWSKDNVPRLGASLAYYTLFSVAPVLLISIAIAGYFFGAEAVRGEIARQLDDLIGPEAAQAVQALLEGASRSDSGRLAAIVGGVTFLIAATGAFMELQHALNTIFRVKLDLAKSKSKILELIKDRVRSFGLVLSLGFLLTVSLVASAALSALSAWVDRNTIVGSPVFWQVVNVVTSLALLTILFMLIFRYLPDVRMQWRHVWVGAVITALLFILGKEAIGLYLGRSSVTSSYGAAGSVIVLLLWVYYASQIILFGAELTRVMAHRNGVDPPPNALASHDPYARPSEG
jgi:membrane protein